MQSRDFFAVFESSDEWRLTASGRTLGTLPISFPVHKDSLVVFAGQRWVVLDVDEAGKVLSVAPHPGGMVPRFEPSSGEPAHDRLLAEMRAVYLDNDVPEYLDKAAQELLAEGRDTFRGLDLERQAIVQEQRDLQMFVWRGSQTTAVFSAVLGMAGLECGVHDLGVTVPKTTAAQMMPILEKLGSISALEPAEVAAFVKNVRAGKFQDFVPEALAQKQWALQNGQFVGTATAIAKSLR
ncbi:DEAD/DEAH box helicase [Bradyrhizobium sp. RDM4]|uniref:DEAD/DEAH box helicase n=1 Tax=Bradyrhizobium sp. RDM4 TaxID=3378765 RepID=UPI0038FD09DE